MHTSVVLAWIFSLFFNFAMIWMQKRPVIKVMYRWLVLIERTKAILLLLWHLCWGDVTVVCRAKVKMDVALDTRAGRGFIRDLETYVMDAPMDVFFVGDDVLQKLGISPQHLLEQKVGSGEILDVASFYPEYLCLNETFNEDDDKVPIGETNDHELLEALENMVLRASKGLREMQGKALRDLVFELESVSQQMVLRRSHHWRFIWIQMQFRAGQKQDGMHPNTWISWESRLSCLKKWVTFAGTPIADGARQFWLRQNLNCTMSSGWQWIRGILTLSWSRSRGVCLSFMLDYARNVATLQELVKRCQGRANSAKASKLSRISLVHESPGWPTMTLLSAASRSLSLTQSRWLILYRTMSCACLQMQVTFTGEES